jgi:putative transposase
LTDGEIKEGELVYRREEWYLNVVIDLPETMPRESGHVVGIDLGENNLAATSTGKVYGGEKLRHRRDMFLNRRSKLQSNGSPSAKRCLQRISGKERRKVKETNHLVAKSIVEDAFSSGANTLAMENLTNIRKRIKARKRERTRLHRWAFSQLQEYIEYKAFGLGMQVVYVNPAYTSKTCYACDQIGIRKKHRFTCRHCGSFQHSDINAAKCICKLGESAVSPRGSVTSPQVTKVFKPLVTSFPL